jgi:predicted HicB family RNase H-like nuclease
MEIKQSQSQNFEDYEILIRKKGVNNYSAYSPQLNLMITGTVHEEVAQQMEEKIREHIENLKK